MASKNEITAMIASLGVVLAIVGGAGWIMTVGIGETLDVATGDGANVSGATNASLIDGTLDTEDRIVVGGMILTLLVAFGVLSATGAGYPAWGRDVISLYPLLLGVIIFISFWDVVSTMLSGDFDFSANTDAFNLYAIYLTGAFLSAVSGVLGWRAKRRGY